MTQTITGKSQGNWRCAGDWNVKLKGFSCPTKPQQSCTEFTGVNCLSEARQGSKCQKSDDKHRWLNGVKEMEQNQGEKVCKSHVMLHFVKEPIEICTLCLLPLLFVHQSSWKIQQSSKTCHSILYKKRKLMSNAVQDGGYSIKCALYNLKL